MLLIGLITLLSFVGGCASGQPAVLRHSEETSQDSGSPLALLNRLKDDGAMITDSEFSIFFPQENAPAISTLSVVAQGNLKITAWAHSKKRSIREAPLSSSQFLELVHDLRSFKYDELPQEDLARCETYSLKIRVEKREAKFVGCRMASHNARVISKLAHKTQFYLLAAGKSTGAGAIPVDQH